MPIIRAFLLNIMSYIISLQSLLFCKTIKGLSLCKKYSIYWINSIGTGTKVSKRITIAAYPAIL